ncbi:MAG TPA: hypothetical protein VGI76_07435 [Solirubrobacteraceae bacterium]
MPPPPPPQQAVAVLGGKRVVWFDDGPILLKGFGSGSTSLGVASQQLPQMASSASAVALVGQSQREFIGGVPPAPLRAIPQPKPVSGGGCGKWQPAAEPLGDFVVVADDLVTAGRATCPPGASATRQPLFARDLRGGHWRVLRWLTGNAPPILAAEGKRLAVGVQYTAGTMRLLVIDIRDGHTDSHFDTSDGYLAFAGSNRLVLSAPHEADGQAVALGPRMRLGNGTYSSGGDSGGPFRLSLYSTKGRRIARLGSSEEPPLVSGNHFITDEGNNGEEVLSVHDIRGGAPKTVIGFNAPARALVTLAFRWPMLVTVETTSTPLLPREVRCWTGSYGPAGQPFLGTFDLARDEPFMPAPVLVSIRPSEPLTDCGPAPP